MMLMRFLHRTPLNKLNSTKLTNIAQCNIATPAADQGVDGATNCKRLVMM
jgi:hypothetical protein